MGCARRWLHHGGHQGDKRSAPGVARLRIEDESWLASSQPSSNRKGCLLQPASTDDGSSWHRSRQSTDASRINSCWVNKLIKRTRVELHVISSKVLIEITQQLTGKGNSVQLILITATEITPQNKIPVHGGKTNNSLLRDMSFPSNACHVNISVHWDSTFNIKAGKRWKTIQYAPSCWAYPPREFTFKPKPTQTSGCPLLLSWGRSLESKPVFQRKGATEAAFSPAKQLKGRLIGRNKGFQVCFAAS